MALHEAGRLGEAERAYRRILRTDPASTGATHLLGVLLSQRGDHGRGVALIRRSISARAEPPTSYFFNLGKALEGQGALADAAARAPSRRPPAGLSVKTSVRPKRSS